MREIREGKEEGQPVCAAAGVTEDAQPPVCIAHVSIDETQPVITQQPLAGSQDSSVDPSCFESVSQCVCCCILAWNTDVSTRDGALDTHTSVAGYELTTHRGFVDGNLETGQSTSLNCFGCFKSSQAESSSVGADGFTQSHSSGVSLCGCCETENASEAGSDGVSYDYGCTACGESCNFGFSTEDCCSDVNCIPNCTLFSGCSIEDAQRIGGILVAPLVLVAECLSDIASAIS